MAGQLRVLIPDTTSHGYGVGGAGSQGVQQGCCPLSRVIGRAAQKRVWLSMEGNKTKSNSRARQKPGPQSTSPLRAAPRFVTSKTAAKGQV